MYISYRSNSTHVAKLDTVQFSYLQNYFQNNERLHCPKEPLTSSLHFTSRHSTSLHSTPLHSTSLHFLFLFILIASANTSGRKVCFYKLSSATKEEKCDLRSVVRQHIVFTGSSVKERINCFIISSNINTQTDE